MTAHLNDHFPYDIDGLVEISGWGQIRRTLTMMRLSVALRLVYRLLMPIHPPERPPAGASFELSTRPVR